MSVMLGFYLGGALVATLAIPVVLDKEYVVYDWRDVLEMAWRHVWIAALWPVLAVMIVGAMVRENADWWRVERRVIIQRGREDFHKEQR